MESRVQVKTLPFQKGREDNFPARSIKVEYGQDSCVLTKHKGVQMASQFSTGSRYIYISYTKFSY